MQEIRLKGKDAAILLRETGEIEVIMPKEEVGPNITVVVLLASMLEAGDEELFALLEAKVPKYIGKEGEQEVLEV
jgi:hypothetical protein